MGCKAYNTYKHCSVKITDVDNLNSEGSHMDNMTVTSLFHKVILTDVLFQQICGFLINADPKNLVSIYLGLGPILYKNNHININNLLNVSGKFGILKKEKFYWKLNKKYSKSYYYDDIYKSKLDSLLTDTGTQLSLNLSRQISTLGSLLNSSWHPKISDVSSLGNVHTLYLHRCNSIKDVSALGNIHTLSLSGCRNIRDVTALDKVHTLDLSRCQNITDVSSLSNVNTLDLRYCSKTINVGALGNVHVFR